MKKKSSFIAAAIALVMITSWGVARTNKPILTIPEVPASNPLIGIWEMTVQGNATYLYKYAISDGTWVTNGNIDRGFLNFTFSPTTGAYIKNADGTFSYRERGWTYTRGGVCNGSFESTGTFELDATGTSFSGPGVFKLVDLNGGTILTENFTVTAVKIPV
jgi:hypothetical protein